ncbi:hypothetical protein [Aquihabitans sp. McL0605]|uniref:hypothetical protein n=1 Tax=Aquihabitans sp. McL0605 TaxID=3415671 RepID=UPI003CE909AA
MTGTVGPSGWGPPGGSGAGPGYAPPPPPPGPLVPEPDDGRRSTAASPLAGLRSQLLTYAVCALALWLVCAAIEQPSWGVVAAVVLGAAVAVAVAADLIRPYGRFAGLVVGTLATMALALLLAFVSAPASTWTVVPLAGLFIAGLDWRVVRRLLVAPFLAGLLVLVGVAHREAWTYPTALAWLVLAFAACASLEADRRAAQPKVAAVSPGPVAPDIRSGDLITTILFALAIALVAALVLSVPSCRHPSPGSSSGFGSSLGSGSGSSSGPGSGRGHYDGNGQWIPDSGRRYVPDAGGQYLVPDDGSGQGQPSGVPSPTLLPKGTTPGRGDTYQTPDGSTLTTERRPDGTGRITVHHDGQADRTFVYRDLPEGTTAIDELDADGNVVRTYVYDPNGKYADQTSGATPASPEQQQKQAQDHSLHVNGRAILAVILGLALIAGIVALVRRHLRRPPPPPAPPWALQLARDLEHEGARRGRPRRRSEPLAAYAAALSDTALPDERIARVGAIVSTALFAAHEPAAIDREWAIATLTQVVDAHPPPTRAERKALASAAAGAPDA